MGLSSSDVLFVGKGTGVVPWYRTGMPSFALGCDWVGFTGAPPHLRMVTSLKRGGHTQPNLYSYKIVVLQQVAGRTWLAEIRRLQSAGITVIYEVDDYLHGVRKIKSHRAKDAYSKAKLAEYELCMRAADAMICSTEWLAQKYRKFNDRIYVCKNSIDGKRYGKFSLPERPTLNIGWAGGEGHLESVRDWLPAVEQILVEFPRTRFVSMGLPVAELLKRPSQAVALPFISIENFPGALCNFDIAIAPAGRGNFFAAKSDLRFLETGALGIPLVADPFVYDDIVDRQTGFLAESRTEAYLGLRELVSSEETRKSVGRHARAHVLANRSIDVVVDQWERVFIEVAT